MRIVNLLFNFKKLPLENHGQQRIYGVERCFVDYAEALEKLGAKVLSVTKRKMVYCEELKAKNLPLLELNPFNQGDIFSILRLCFELFRFKPDIAICHPGRAYIFTYLARLILFKKFPIIAIDHGINPKKFLKADLILAVNYHTSSKIIAAGKSEKQVGTIPNMLKIPPDFKLPIKPKYTDKVRIGSIGRFSGEKAFDKILLAVKILKDRGVDVSFKLGGAGILEDSYKQMAKDLEIEDCFEIKGWIDEKSKFFEEIDIFILPSFIETFGVVLLEAMLYNTPIITTDTWGANEIIDDGVNGLKISLNDPQKIPDLIADSVVKLMQNQDFAKNLASSAHQKFLNNFEALTVARKLLKYCEERISEKLENK